MENKAKSPASLDHETAKIDTLIREQARLIALLQEKRQAVISHAVTKGLDPNVPMKDSGVEWLGKVPAHWGIAPLKKLIQSIESGTSVNAADIPATIDEFGVLKTSCVYGGTFRPSENKTVMENEVGRLSCPLRPGTLIVSRMNTPDLVGSAGLVEGSYTNLFLPDRLWQVTFSTSALTEFLDFWTKTGSYRDQIKIVCAGTSSSMQNIGQDDFRSFVLAIPPLSEQLKIVSLLKNQTTRIDSLVHTSTTAIALLNERRSALISAAVTGKIDVRNWQAPEQPAATETEQEVSFG